MRFVYSYLMKDRPDDVRRTGPQHAAYWNNLGLTDYLGGPFADRSGGLIIFEEMERERAAELVSGDPFQRADLVDNWSLKVWLPQ